MATPTEQPATIIPQTDNFQYNLKQIITRLNIKDFFNFLLHNIHTNAAQSHSLSIVHMVIGANMREPDILNPLCNRTHEFPQIVRKLFTNPNEQVSPELFQEFYHLPEIHIRQTLFLVDPDYERFCEPLQFITELTKLCEFFPIIIDTDTRKISIVHQVQLTDIKFIKIHCHLEIVVIPCEISREIVDETIVMINSFSRFNPIVLYVMDCSSSITNELFVNNTDSAIFLTESKCLLIDSELQNCPTLSVMHNKKQRKQYDTQETHEKQETYDSTDTQINTHPRQIFNIRWVNLHDDMKHLPDWCEISDICMQSKSSYEFLANLLKFRRINIELVGLIKLWTFFNLKLSYTLDDARYFNIPITVEHKDFDYVRFGYFCKSNHFLDYIIHNCGFWQKYEILYCIKNLNKTIRTINNNKDMIPTEDGNMFKVLTKYAVDIFHELSVYIPEVVGYYEDEMINRKFVVDFIASQKILL